MSRQPVRWIHGKAICHCPSFPTSKRWWKLTNEGSNGAWLHSGSLYHATPCISEQTKNWASGRDTWLEYAKARPSDKEDPWHPSTRRNKTEDEPYTGREDLIEHIHLFESTMVYQRNSDDGRWLIFPSTFLSGGGVLNWYCRLQHDTVDSFAELRRLFRGSTYLPRWSLTIFWWFIHHFLKAKWVTAWVCGSFQPWVFSLCRDKW